MPTSGKQDQSKLSGIPRAPLRWNMFGEPSADRAQNKLFFFVDYQGSDSTIHRQAASYRIHPDRTAGNLGALQSRIDASACVPIGSPVRESAGHVRREATRTDVWCEQLFNPCAAGTGISGVLQRSFDSSTFRE